MLTILGILSAIVFTGYVIDGIVRKNNYIIDQKQNKIGGLEAKYNETQEFFSGNYTCYEPECEVPSLQETIPLLFNETAFIINALEGEIS